MYNHQDPVAEHGDRQRRQTAPAPGIKHGVWTGDLHDERRERRTRHLHLCRVLPNAAPDVTCANGATDGEQVTITSTASTTTTQKWLPQDTAHVTAQGGATVAGNVVFKLYESIDCTGTAVQTFGSGTATDPLIPVDANGNATTNNTTYYMDTNIQISWKATFTSTNGVASGNPAPCERSDIANLDDDITSP